MNYYKLEDLKIGMKQEFHFNITEEMMEYFCKMTGDTNPLHCSLEYANKHGFSQKVVYGMLTASFLSTLAGVYLPGERSLIQSVEILFKAPVFPNDDLVLCGEVADINNEHGFITIKFSILKENNKKVCRGKMQVGVR